MSPVRLVLLVALAVTVVGATWLASNVLGFAPLPLFLVIGFAASLVLFAHVYWLSRSALRPLRLRACTGRAWKQCFPQAPSDHIRQFLSLVNASLALPLRPLQLHPSDRPFDLYRALYPFEAMPDACELESLALSFERAYGRDLTVLWRPDISLKDIYAFAIAP